VAYEGTISGIRALDPGVQRRQRAEEQRATGAADWAKEKRGMERRLMESTIAKSQTAQAETERLSGVRSALSGVDTVRDAMNLFNKDQNRDHILKAEQSLVESGNEKLIPVLKGMATGSATAMSEFDVLYNNVEQKAIDNKIRDVKHSAAWLKTKDEGIAPGSTAGKARIKELNTSKGQTINIGAGNALQEFTKEVLTDMSQRAAGAATKITAAEMGLDILRNRIQGGNETGKWAPIKTEAAAWLGINEDEVAEAQIFDVLMGDKVMARIQETKGAISNKEMTYFQKISPGSEKEPFTNYALLEISRRAAFREQDKMQYLREYLSDNEDLIGFDQWYMKNRDPFGEFNLKELEAQYDEWVGAPSSGVPSGWDAEDWKYLTPEEQEQARNE